MSSNGRIDLNAQISAERGAEAPGLLCIQDRCTAATRQTNGSNGNLRRLHALQVGQRFDKAERLKVVDGRCS